HHSVSPTPSDEEAIAISTAIELLWPIAQPATPPTSTNTTWRFSGRWWVGSSVTRGSRPDS
ncbi:MAG: hypothetical protein AAB018_00435, partial [Actinomycetota bacterium]